MIPSSLSETRYEDYRLEVGDHLYHVYNTRHSAVSFNPEMMPPGAVGGSRFDALLIAPHKPGYAPYSSYYFGWTRCAALWETIIRDNIRPAPYGDGGRILQRSLLRDRALATVKVVGDLLLVNLVGRKAQEAAMLTPADLHATEPYYDGTRHIVNRIRRETAHAAGGLRWRSWQDDSALVGLLMGRPFLPEKVPVGYDEEYYSPSWPGGTGSSHVWAESLIEKIDTVPLESTEGLHYVHRALPRDVRLTSH